MTRKRPFNYSSGALLLVLLAWTSPAFAQTAPSLGNAAAFAVLGGSTVTNTGATVLRGNVGVSPGNAITGFPPGTLTGGGTSHAGDATAAAAQVSLTTAYNALVAQTPTQNLTGQDLGGKTLIAGVYKFDTSAQLTGTLTLDARGSSDAVFIFQIGTALTTATDSTVTMINGGSLCNVYWQIGSSATLGTETSFVGNILALTSITLNTSATVVGRALARNGAVTLDTNTATAASCTTAGVPGGTPAGCPVIGISPATVPNANVGVFYSERFTGTSGTAPYTYTTDQATLPAGLILSTGGRLSGTPTIATAQTFKVRATDSLGCFAERSFTILFGVAVPTLPQYVFFLLAAGLMAMGYRRLRRSAA